MKYSSNFVMDCFVSQRERFPIYLPQEKLNELSEIANKLVIKGKGILAADETPTTLGIRFKFISLANTPENRRAYRQMLFSADPVIAKYISGIILHPETLMETTEDGVPLTTLITDRKILYGVKVDLGVVEIPGSFAECTTQGLDNLAERCRGYKRDGCQFAKWRCALKICSKTPSLLAMKETSNVIARYAVISQIAGLVPIIEPEILCDGNHTLEVSKYTNEAMLSFVYKALADHHVYLEGTILKTNIIRSGHTCCKQSTLEENAEATVEVMQRTVPVSVPGILFLSGGLSENRATLNLNEINRVKGKKPWTLTFSFGRALQSSILDAWEGKPEKRSSGQCELLRLAKANSSASMGFYEGVKKTPIGERSMFVASHAY